MEVQSVPYLSSQQPCKAGMWAERWAPGSGRGKAPLALFSSSTKRSGFLQHTSEVSSWLVLPLQRNGGDCDLTGTCISACPRSRAFVPYHVSGEAWGRIVLSVSTHSLHWHPGFVFPQVTRFCTSLCPYALWVTTPNTENPQAWGQNPELFSPSF